MIFRGRAKQIVAWACLCGLSACATSFDAAARDRARQEKVAQAKEAAAKAEAQATLEQEKLEREKAEAEAAVSSFCGEIERLYKRNRWGQSICRDVPFKIIGWSVQHRPIVSFEAGDPKSSKRTVIQCGIHGDELPALAMCFRMIYEVMQGKKSPPANSHLIVQPLLNPDGMLAGKPQRPNARGVDINRNFPTQDFAGEAVSSWNRKDRGDPRKFPGNQANSEPETQAIVKYIEQMKPQKIIAIHTPLGFLDLDSKGGVDMDRRARFLAVNMSKNSGNYTFKSFGYYPGSLGNFAGRERQIPTYTLELPEGKNSRPTIDNYWARFRIALWRAVEFDLDTGDFIEHPEED